MFRSYCYLLTCPFLMQSSTIRQGFPNTTVCQVVLAYRTRGSGLAGICSDTLLTSAIPLASWHMVRCRRRPRRRFMYRAANSNKTQQKIILSARESTVHRLPRFRIQGDKSCPHNQSSLCIALLSHDAYNSSSGTGALHKSRSVHLLHIQVTTHQPGEKEQ